MTPPSVSSAQDESNSKPFEMWTLPCPMRKDGVPVLGSFGSRVEVLVIFTAKEWLRLTDAVPQILDTQFSVGSYDDD